MRFGGLHIRLYARSCARSNARSHVRSHARSYNHRSHNHGVILSFFYKRKLLIEAASSGEGKSC